MTRWSEVSTPAGDGPRPRRSAALRLLVPLALALGLALLGHRVLALIVATAAALLTLVSALWPPAGAAVERAFAAFGHGVATALSWLLLGVVQLVVVLPLHLLARVAGRDPLGGRKGASTVWAPRPGPVPHRRTFGPEAIVRPEPGRLRRGLAAVPRVLGAIVALLLLDFGLGWLWDEYAGSHDNPVSTIGAPSDTPLGVGDLGAEPWAAAYEAELAALPIDPVPLLLHRVGDVQGELISSRDGVRRSYTAANLPDDAPEVWFVGGGPAWGLGQRDEHTVASEVAREAEAAGTPITAVNLAQPGYTIWQAALLLEQELAVRPTPDAVVVYAGPDDVAVQLEDASAAPTHYNADGLSVALTGRDSAREEVDDLLRDYRDTSLLAQLARGIGGLFAAQPAAAADDDLADRVLDLHDRARAVMDDLADRYGTELLVVWPPAEGVPGDGGAYREVATRAEDDLDLSGLLDDESDEVFLDPVHPDERGAAVVGAALWEELSRTL